MGTKLDRYGEYIRHGTHVPGNDYDGYMYSRSTSESYQFYSHIHECYEIIHVISGQLLYTVEEHEYLLSGGDIIMTTPDELHSFSFPEECEYKREFLHIYPGFIENVPEVDAMFKSRKRGTFNQIPADKVKKYGLDKIFDDIYKTCTNPSDQTDMIVFANTILFAAKVNQMLAEDAPEYPKIDSNSKVKMIYHYIDLNYMYDITTDSIAKEMLMSAASIRRLFKKETGMSVKSYLSLRRVTAAKNRIMVGQKAKNVYIKCGFKDYSTFYRTFIKYVGMAPDEFKHRYDDRKNKDTA